MAVASLLMAGLTALLIYSLRSLRQFNAYNTVQQQTTLALQSLSEDLGLSNTAGMLLNTADVCTIPSPCGLRSQPDWKVMSYTGTDLNYRSWVCYYRAANGDLHRAEQDMGGSYTVSTIPVGSRPALAVFSALTSSANRIVARNLVSFQVDSTTTPATVQVGFRVSVQIDSTHATDLRTATQVRVRN